MDSPSKTNETLLEEFQQKKKRSWTRVSRPPFSMQYPHPSIIIACIFIYCVRHNAHYSRVAEGGLDFLFECLHLLMWFFGWL